MSLITTFLNTKEPTKKILFMQNYNENETLIGSKKLRKGKEEIRYRGKTYKIDINNIGFIKGRSIFYFVDVINGQQTIGKNILPLTADELDLFVAKRTLSNVLLNIGHKPMDHMTLLFLIAGVICGIPLGMILGPYLVV